MSKVPSTPESVAKTPKPTRRVQWRYVGLVVLFALLALAIYALGSPTKRSLKVTGPLTARDVKAIQHGLRHAQYQALQYSITHLKPKMLWSELGVIRRCPLVSITSYDTNNAFATFHGSAWSGNDVTIVHQLTNQAGVWLSYVVTRSETVTKNPAPVQK